MNLIETCHSYGLATYKSNLRFCSLLGEIFLFPRMGERAVVFLSDHGVGACIFLENMQQYSKIICTEERRSCSDD